jgi:2-C-methyl-D-erythritol 4-phosphate cytidylyltransferase
VIVAAGSGSRLGAGQPKAMVCLGGRPILNWSVASFGNHPQIDELVVVVPAERVAGIAAELASPTVQVVAGGASRQESVAAGLSALSDAVQHVLIQDAARPLVSTELISAVLAALADGAEAVVPVLPVLDTIRQVDDGGQLLRTVDRGRLRRVQTPQGFQLTVLRAAHAAGSVEAATDDAALVEALGRPVGTVPGDEAAFKITTQYDLRLAELLVSG